MIAQTHTLKSAIEENIKSEIPAEHPMMTWAVEHAGWLLRRYNVGSDGKTPYQRSKGRRCNRKLVELGEKVWFQRRERDNADLGPLQARFSEGIFLGMSETSGEHIVWATGGLLRTRDIRRVPLAQRWDKDKILSVNASPQTPNPGSSDGRIRAFARGTDDIVPGQP